mmetsp:Transcript_7545/g.22036  ORF Transcript_7545/g.22036 Transcript_7545/m.22036 type:complete len:786 (-) Transcript_7545:2991-5348(-)
MKTHPDNCYNAWSIALLVHFLLLSLSLLVDAGSVRNVAVTHRDDNTEGAHTVQDDNPSGLGREQQMRRDQEGNEPQPKQVVSYHIWDSVEIAIALNEWKETYPELIRLTTSQEAYGLPTSGGNEDCPFYEKSEGCPNYFFTIQDFVTHPIDSPSSSHLPEVFLSGCLHGNERVGPSSVMEASALLLEAAHCEALPRSSLPSSDNLDADLEEAKKCREALRTKGIDDVHRKWLARLVSTRRIVVAPNTNSLGHFRNERGESGVDPNRDFPYDLNDPSLCMQTIAGRTANEIFREHMFQLAITFHGGMEVVGYEWGAPSFLNFLSPDDVAQSQIGGAYSRYGGGWDSSHPYKFGTMNDLVYYVRGGMEDWAYGGSFTPDKVTPCTPKTYGGYPLEKTMYNNSTLRVFNMLVETSNFKEPKTDLGTSMDVLDANTKGNGHVSRNIRLSLLAIDMVQPYVGIVGVNKLALADDIVPKENREPNSCLETKAVMVAQNAKTVDIEWTVGGAMAIDNTELWYAKWDDILSEGSDACWTQPDNTDLLQRVETASANTGFGFFSDQGPLPRPEESATGIRMTNGPLFRATIPLDKFKKGEKVMVMASARVDQSWKNQPANIKPSVPPQSHVVNARTDPEYHHESNGKHIQGRLDWFSVPITIVIGDFKDSVGMRGDDAVDAVEMYSRFVDNRSINKGGVKPNSAQGDQSGSSLSLWGYVVVIALSVSLSVCCIRCLCGRKHPKPKRRTSSVETDDLPLEQEQYSDQTDDEYCDDDDEDDDEEQSYDGIEIPTIT